MKLGHVTKEQCNTIISHLKQRKAADVYGLSAEYLQYVHSDISIIIARHIINRIIDTSEVPAILKIGLISPVYKKKSILNPDSYRRITVTALLCKVLEKIII
jgi:hypothetical protein